MTFRESPPLGAVLYGIEIPPVGGDTMFCNMYLAYQTLSQGMKALVGRLRGIHFSGEPARHATRYRAMSMQRKADKRPETNLHPLVRTHPVTGKTSLFICPAYCRQLEDMTPEESRPLLEHLERHATRHEFSCRFPMGADRLRCGITAVPCTMRWKMIWQREVAAKASNG